jgi:AraC family transcriptional regulator, exoenzyme S synthesis regulatory protein ExsA
MIISHKKFELWGQTLIETVNIRAPFRFSVRFPQQACFLYYKQGKTVIHSAYEQVEIKSDESVILNCGNYFADLLEYPEGDFFDIIVFHLHAETLKKLYRQEFPSFLKKDGATRSIGKIASGDVVRGFIENLDFYFENPALINDDILELKVKELVLILLQSKNAESIRSLLRELFMPYEVNLRELVQRHLFSGIAIKDLAGLASMSLPTFNRRFYEIYDNSPASYIKAKRLERARELLEVSSLSISEIAFETCFKDIPHFSRSFKQRFRVSPASYRQKG